MIALLAGCAFGPGTGFATLEDARLVAAFVPGEARDLGDGAFLTDEGYDVALARFEVVADRVELLELEGGTAGAFDPANPPPGYTLCHGGHCHAADGALVSYAAIEAELAGPDAAFVPVVDFAITPLDLLAGEPVDLGRPRPSPELPAARITLVRIAATALRIEGEVGGGDLDAPVALTVDLPIGPIEGGTELLVDRSTPAELALAIDWTVDGTVLDGLPFGALAADGVVTLTDAADPAADTLLANLTAAAPTLEVR